MLSLEECVRVCVCACACTNVFYLSTDNCANIYMHKCSENVNHPYMHVWILHTCVRTYLHAPIGYCIAITSMCARVCEYECVSMADSAHTSAPGRLPHRSNIDCIRVMVTLKLHYWTFFFVNCDGGILGVAMPCGEILFTFCMDVLGFYFLILWFCVYINAYLVISSFLSWLNSSYSILSNCFLNLYVF